MLSNPSLSILICVSHDWVCCAGNHQGIIPNGEKSDKTQCSWLQPVWLWTRYCPYSRMPEWIDTAAFERMSICFDLITIWRWVQLSFSKWHIIIWHINCCVISFWKACWVSNTDQKLHELSMSGGCSTSLPSQNKITPSYLLLSPTTGRPVLPFDLSAFFLLPGILINISNRAFTHYSHESFPPLR